MSDIFYYNADTKIEDKNSIRTLVIEEGTLCIEEKTFNNCKNLEKIIFPKSLKKIKKEAFNNCYRLKEVILPENIIIIGEAAFANCTLLETFDASKTKILNVNHFLFANDFHLKNLKLPISVVKLGQSAFLNCENLTEFYMSKNINDFFATTFAGSGIEIVYYDKNIPKHAIDNFSRYFTEEKIAFLENNLDTFLKNKKSFKEINKIFKDNNIER